ncbi:MAG: redox-sensing transcriptional repressor Rex [Epulopiscium sp. Nuni2H_MBin003]|nr:MAG: redox-sensing transcriptional repressor Rex [Epulopiscium sp. Nuni2H_MBin003]
MTERKISMAVIRRLPRYYRYLGELLDNGVTKVSSSKLSVSMNVTASQIRQDLNNFGGFGQQGYGYNVEHLYTEIGKILGLNRVYKMVLIGAGNLGQALANYQTFNKRGFELISIFDLNPKVVGLFINGIEVLDIDKLYDFLQTNPIDIAILTMPQIGVEQMASNLVKWGVKGIWNFSPVDLTSSSNVVIENVNLSYSLMTLAYQIHQHK